MPKRSQVSNNGRASGQFFSTFITPEAKTALQEYLTERKNAGEIVTAESPLITDYSHKNSISGAAFEKVWKRLLRKSGLNQKSGSFYVLHVHTLRKYFRSNCIGVDVSYRERCDGSSGVIFGHELLQSRRTITPNRIQKSSASPNNLWNIG